MPFWKATGSSHVEYTIGASIVHESVVVHVSDVVHVSVVGHAVAYNTLSCD